MKKLIAVILALVFVLSLSACGKEEPASDLDYVKEKAKACGVQIFGGRGIIGACAAVSLKHQPQEVLLDSRVQMH